MKFILKIDGINIFVTQKKIKNLNLRVTQPEGIVKISAPYQMSTKKVSNFIFSKIGWIKNQRLKIKDIFHKKQYKFVENEIHYFGGKGYILKIVLDSKFSIVQLTDNQIILNLPSNAGIEKRRYVLEEWYKLELMKEIPSIVSKWEKILNVSLTSYQIRRMKTRWGSCTPKTRRIRLNLELAKMSTNCLELSLIHI